MGHLSQSRTRTEDTPREWLKVGSQIGELTNTWADREDIIAYVGPGAGGDAAACFVPAIAEMELNVDVAFTPGADPRLLGDMTERATQFDWPKASGAILHESMHAKHTRWSFDELNDYGRTRPLAVKIALLFEESRIELRGIMAFPDNRAFLRASALEIVVGDIDPAEIMNNGLYGLSHLMLLTLARVDARVLNPEDVEFVREKAQEVLGEDLIGQLREIWLEAQLHDKDREIKPLLALAERWLELLPDIEKENEQLKEALQAIMSELGAAAESTEIKAEQEAGEQNRREKDAAAVAAAAAATAEERNHREAADDYYSGKNSMAGNWGVTRSELKAERDPTLPERAAAARLGRQLDKARYHDRVRTTHRSAVPPGRMRTQVLMQGEVERSRGAVSTVEPFRRIQRHHVQDPNLTVGVIVDISGSMKRAMLPMGITAWLLSEASKRIGARCAMNYCGQSVFPVLRPGQHLDKVRTYTAPDYTEEFDSAFKVTDGALNLLHGAGARLLVVCSDMHYRDDQRRKGERWLRRCTQAGVAVLVVTYDDGSSAHWVRRIPGVQVVVAQGMEPVDAASTIGKAAVKALEDVGRGR